MLVVADDQSGTKRHSTNERFLLLEINLRFNSRAVFFLRATEGDPFLVHSSVRLQGADRSLG